MDIRKSLPLKSIRCATVHGKYTIFIYLFQTDKTKTMLYTLLSTQTFDCGAWTIYHVIILRNKSLSIHGARKETEKN